ncbi:MAG: hypothetical protein ACJ763_13730 [Bdellovibrionia bacterium]
MHRLMCLPHALKSAPVPFLVMLIMSGASFSGCSVVVGNVKPIEEKSTEYGVMDLSHTNPDWQKLDPAKTAAQSESVKEQDVSPTEVTDVAYQSKSTASIISLDSACRLAPDSLRPGAERDLKTLTDLLLLGITDVTLREERGMEVQKTPALETTIIGKLNGEAMQIRTVVLKRQNCVYDLVYMSRPQYFERQLSDFSHFVASLKLRE